MSCGMAMKSCMSQICGLAILLFIIEWHSIQWYLGAHTYLTSFVREVEFNFVFISFSALREPMCGSRKYPYPPHGRSLEIPRGRGVQRQKFPRGVGGS